MSEKKSSSIGWWPKRLFNWSQSSDEANELKTFPKDLATDNMTYTSFEAIIWSTKFDYIWKPKEELFKIESTMRNWDEESTPDSVQKHPLLTRNLKKSAKSAEIKSLVADFRANGPFSTNARVGQKDKPKPNPMDKQIANLRIDVNPRPGEQLAVLFSSFSSLSSNAPNYCVKPWIINMDFYGSNDIPLGAFLERYCFRASYTCASNNCSTPMIEHVRRFVHSNGCILIVLRQLQQKVEAAQNAIISWYWCQKCKRGTPYSNLSPDSWLLSFAEYLEMKFYGSDCKGRATCSSQACMDHSLHIDHFQFFAYKQVVASFNYMSIQIHEITLPPTRLSFDSIGNPSEDMSFLIRDDDPGSVIAYALSTPEYKRQISELSANSSSPLIKRKFTLSSEGETTIESSVVTYSKVSSKEMSQHIELQYNDSTPKFYCCVYFAEQFRKFRAQIFGSSDGEELYLRSLSTCMPWKARGGKSGSTFWMTLNDRFILKEMSKLELQSFLNIANYYFDYCERAFKESRPSLLARIVGIYRPTYKNSASNNSSKSYLLVMENLFFNCNITQKFDLKGSMRNRLVDTNCPDLKADQLVLLDENLMQMTCDCPLYVHSDSKAILSAAIDNDSTFLTSHSVIDYSLLVGIDDQRNQFIVGIIDYIRPFTWDKKLESVVKSVGSQGKLPTIVQPDTYRIRFCEAMDQYFLCVPDKCYNYSNLEATPFPFPYTPPTPLGPHSTKRDG